MGTKGDKLTKAASEICEELVQNLAPLGQVSSKKMFGGHGIFERGTMFALINAQGDLFFKVGEANRARFEAVGAQQHGKMPYFTAPVEALEDVEALRHWAKGSIEVAHSTKKQ